MRKLLWIAGAVVSQSIFAASGMYSWMDESGNLTFGDSPPSHVAAKPINPPKLTVLENFANRYATIQPQSAPPEEKSPSKKVVQEQVYQTLNIIAPRQGQSIRANDGEVSVALTLSPRLRSGDQVLLMLDGQEVSRGTSRIVNLSHVERGPHQLSIRVVSQDSQELIRSKPVTFYVLRHSALLKKPFDPYTQEPDHKQDGLW